MSHNVLRRLSALDHKRRAASSAQYGALVVFLFLFLGTAGALAYFILPYFNLAINSGWGLLILGLTFLGVLIAASRFAHRDIVSAIA